MSDRGMKKWAPFRSLTEQMTSLNEMHRQKHLIEKPLIASDKAEEINRILVNYSEGEILLVSIYQRGEIFKKEIQIKEIDMVNRCLILNTRERIYLKDIVDLEKL